MTDFKMGAKVTLTNSRKTDGRYNHGIIVGIEKSYPYLAFHTEAQFFKSFVVKKYKVAYVDCFTGKACSDWVSYEDVVKYDKSYGEVK